ncbi:MAG: hypothetical protein ACRD2R_09055 [Terriglobales bacterium]
MALKPTVKKLRLSLTTMAALLAYLSYELILRPPRPGDTLLMAFSFLGVILCLVDLYLSFRFNRLQAQASGRIVAVALASAAWMLVAFVFSPIGGLNDARGYMLFAGLVITWYLVRNVKKVGPAEAPTKA